MVVPLRSMGKPLRPAIPAETVVADTTDQQPIAKGQCGVACERGFQTAQIDPFEPEQRPE